MGGFETAAPAYPARPALGSMPQVPPQLKVTKPPFACTVPPSFSAAKVSKLSTFSSPRARLSFFRMLLLEGWFPARGVRTAAAPVGGPVSAPFLNASENDLRQERWSVSSCVSASLREIRNSGPAPRFGAS